MRQCLCNTLVCSSFRNEHFFLLVKLESIEHKNIKNRLFSITLLWGWLLWQCFLADNTDLCLIHGVFLVQNIAWKWICFKLGHVCITLAKTNHSNYDCKVGEVQPQHVRRSCLCPAPALACLPAPPQLSLAFLTLHSRGNLPCSALTHHSLLRDNPRSLFQLTQ